MVKYKTRCPKFSTPQGPTVGTQSTRAILTITPLRVPASLSPSTQPQESQSSPSYRHQLSPSGDRCPILHHLQESHPGREELSPTTRSRPHPAPEHQELCQLSMSPTVKLQAPRQRPSARQVRLVGTPFTVGTLKIVPLQVFANPLQETK